MEMIFLGLLVCIFGYFYFQRVNFSKNKYLKALQKKEAELEENNQKLSIFFDQMQDGLLVIDPASRKFLEFNKAAYENLGYTKEEFADLEIDDIEHIENTQDIQEHIQKMQSQGYDNFQTKHKAKDGSIKDVNVVTKFITLQNRQLIMATFHDITQIKRNKTKIFENQKTLAMALQSVGIGVWTWDIIKDELLWDNRMFELYDASIEEFGGAYEAWFARIHPEDKLTQEQISLQARAGAIPYDTEFRIVHRDGKVKYIKANAIIIRDDEGNPKKMIGVNWDVTQNKLYEEQTRLASMGEMIGNIAHQWRQPLSVITTVASGIKFKIDCETIDTQEVAHEMQMIVDQSKYLSNTIDDFRNYIKGGLEKNSVPLSKVIEKTINLIAPALKSNEISLCVNIAEDGVIECYENELIQVFLNILSNAKDAINEHVLEDDERIIMISTFKNGNDIVLKIQDNGGGIPPHIMGRIFEPYFTTKHQSLGTGLGLAMVRDILIGHHRAQLEVNNVIFPYNYMTYKGACFTIAFVCE